MNTVEHTYDVCPKYSELGSFRIIAVFLGTVAAADSAKVQGKKVQRFYI